MRRLPLLWRVFLSTSIVTTGLFVLIGYIVNAHSLHITSVMLEEELRSSFRAYQSLWTSRADHLASLSQVISGMPDVRAAFGTGDAATIRDTASELWSRVPGLDAVFLVTDPAGNVIASLSGSALAPLKRIDAVQQVARDFPKQGSGFSFLGERLFQLVITPVYVDAGRGRALINVLVAGYVVDDAFAFALKNATAGSESLIIAGGRVVASTVPGFTANRIAAQKVRADQVEEVHIGKDSWSVLATGLSDLNGGRLGELRVLRPYTASRVIADLGLQIAVIWAVAILFVLLVTFMLARRLLGPIRLLDDAAREVSRGNYDCRVTIAGGGEMSRLGDTFNDMCASIRSNREELIRQERITTLGRIASSIVHDLRNPLAAIYGGAEMLVDADGLPPSHTKRLAGNIYRASRQILTLLDDLTAITRGKAPDKEVCRIADVIDDAWSSVSPQAESAGVGFTVTGDTGIEASLARSRIERVFVNLFTNAIQAMPKGGAVRVALGRTGAVSEVTVCDTGPGVPAQIRENLFQPFTSAGKSNGLGLGLALSRQTVIENGGDLWLEETASGACFKLRFPACSPAPSPRPANSAALP